ncbi:MAG TPA: penicillin-binding protein 2 [Longimicrobiales bacterium]|nr:penicillin-binding protein 2 [Longimicrobiales bacterium]
MQRTGRLATPRAQRVRRSRAARVVIIATIAFLGTALARLQIVRGDEYEMKAKEYRYRALPIPAPRGTIYDRHGRVLADNVPGFQIQIMPPDVKSTSARQDSMRAQVVRLQPVIGATDDQVNRAFRKWLQQSHLPLVIMEDASEHAVAAIAERHYMYPNVLVHQYPKRRYPAGPAIAHFIGFVNEINERQLQTPDFEGYEQGRWIGQAGLERQYEKHLGGRPGRRLLEVDARGRIQRWLPESASEPAIPGSDLHLYLDLDLQQYIYEIFPREFDGAVVAIDPQTGGVLAYYSNPTYDPNLWIGGISTEEFRKLNEDPRLPLVDRVVNSGQPAASTWKLAVAGMALDLGVITPEEYMPVACNGGIGILGDYRRCHGQHGRQNLMEGIKNSCNVYFYQVGVRIGLRRMLEHGVRIGFGEKTGIDVPHEMTPVWPSGPDYWVRRFGYQPKETEVLSLAIGQGPLTMSIIKLAHIYAALTAPSGKVPAPRLAMESGSPKDTIEFHTTPRDRWYLEAGMRRVVAPGGTAGRSRYGVPGIELPWDFIGKTGTAQAPDYRSGGKDHGWFVGTGAPAVGAPPEIAVTMFLARSEHGYTSSGYVGEIINFYLSRKYGKPFTKWATTRFRSEQGLPVDYVQFMRPVVDPPIPAATGGG